MERPDENGCHDCGRVNCPILQLGSEYTPAAFQAAYADCVRHALDWRALYFEARTPPAEVAGMVEEALALDAAATPGPWHVYGKEGSGYEAVSHRNHDGTTDYTIAETHGSDTDEDNREFIARARTLLPALARALRAAKPAGDGLRATAAHLLHVLADFRNRPPRLEEAIRALGAEIDRIAPREGA